MHGCWRLSRRVQSKRLHHPHMRSPLRHTRACAMHRRESTSGPTTSSSPMTISTRSSSIDMERRPCRRGRAGDLSRQRRRDEASGPRGRREYRRQDLLDRFACQQGQWRATAKAATFVRDAHRYVGRRAHSGPAQIEALWRTAGRACVRQTLQGADGRNEDWSRGVRWIQHRRACRHGRWRVVIGFRNPLTEKKLEALVLELKNPAAVVERGAKPVFGDLIPLISATGAFGA